MLKEINYKKWAEEYELETIILKEKIAKLKENRKHIKSFEEKENIEKRLYILTGMYMQCRYIYNTLIRRSVYEDRSYE